MQTRTRKTRDLDGWLTNVIELICEQLTVRFIKRFNKMNKVTRFFFKGDFKLFCEQMLFSALEDQLFKV